MSPVLYWLWGVLASTLYWYLIEALDWRISALVFPWKSFIDWMTSSCCRVVWNFCFLDSYTLLIFHLSILFLFFTWVFLKLLLADGIAPCVLWKHLCIGIAHWVFLYWNISLGLLDHLCIVIACLVFFPYRCNRIAHWVVLELFG